MTKARIAQWDTTAANNTDINDISIAENATAVSDLNNMGREFMAQIAQWTGEGAIASAATCNIGAQAEEFLNVTGTATITSFGTVRAGTKRTLLFASALTITHNATSLILASGGNFVTAAGDMLTFISEGSGNWRQVDDSSKLNKDGSGISTTAEKGALLSALGAGILSGFRNKIINGGFDFWQRGTNFSINGSYTADRWVVGGGGTGFAGTVTRSAELPGRMHGQEFALVIQQTGGDAPMQALQNIEDVRTFAGKKVTVTFYARNNDNNPTMGVRLDQIFGADGSANVVGTTEVVNIADGMYSVTIDVPSVVGKTIGAGSALRLYLFNSVAGVNTFPSAVVITNVSVVEGDATAEDDPFSPRHIQQELALCQRYYQKIIFERRWTASGAGQIWGTSLEYPTKMRVTPAKSFTSGGFTNVSSPEQDTTELEPGVSTRIQYTTAAAGDCLVQSRVLTLDAEL